MAGFGAPITGRFWAPHETRVVRECNIRNYSIYPRVLPDRKSFLFSYFEYQGDDFDKNMSALAAYPTIQQ